MLQVTRRVLRLQSGGCIPGGHCVHGDSIKYKHEACPAPGPGPAPSRGQNLLSVEVKIGLAGDNGTVAQPPASLTPASDPGHRLQVSLEAVASWVHVLTVPCQAPGLRACRDVYNPRALVSLTRVCEDCYNLYREVDLYNQCTSDCFSSPVFMECTKSLLLNQPPTHSVQ